MNQAAYATRRRNSGENKRRGSSVKHLEEDAWKNKLAAAERGLRAGTQAGIPLIERWQLATFAQFLRVYVDIHPHSRFDGMDVFYSFYRKVLPRVFLFQIVPKNLR